MITPFYMMQPYYFSGPSPVQNCPFIIEKWKYLDSSIDPRITGESNMYISTCGRVWSETKREVITPYATRDGYYYIVIHQKQFTIHRLVMLAFFRIDGCEQLDVNHRNGIKSNCSCTNLEWTSTSENLYYAHKNHLRNQPKGVNHYKATLNDDELNTICKLLCNGVPCKEIAELINCSPDKISRILNGTCYTEYYNKYNLARYTKPRETNRLTEDEIIKFKNAIESYSGPKISNAELQRRALKDIGINLDYTPAVKIYLRRICRKYGIVFE